MRKPTIKILDKNAHWWSSEKIDKWAIQDKEGAWWLISGSEFPEAKIKNGKEKMSCGLPPTFNLKDFFVKFFYAVLLGASLAINIFLLFVK